MRNLKKFLAMALTVLMVVGSFGMVASANFDDVVDFQEAVNVMTDLGIACGYEDGTFGETDPVERQQLALWIAKIMTGKTDATYVANNFVGGVNYTAFVDVEDAEDLDVYTGAINYAANNGIIVGTSATTFEPTESVLLQDVFAMAVRMLGYGSTAMNNNYPYSFIDKAISLGLDAGLGEEYIVDANATRGQTMQVLYNALTVAKSDGSTLGYDYFNVEKATVVITGTKALNVFTNAKKVTATVDDEDYIAFSVLNADGTVSGDAYYYALRSEFGFDAETDVNLLLGYSYDVLTNDNFKTFITCEQNTAKVVDQTSVVGNADGKAKTTVTIDEEAYTLVKKYTSEVYGNTLVENDKEIIMYVKGTVAPSFYASSYVYNNELDIMDSRDTTKVLLHWFPTFGTEGYVMNGGVYLFQLADGNYIEPNDYIWSLAAKNTYGPEEAAHDGYVATLDSKADIYDNGAYTEAVLFDDDNNGTWDRGILARYAFAKATVASDGVLNLSKTKDATVYVDGEKADYAAIKDQYVMYYYNSLINTLFVKEIYTTNSALVTGVDVANDKVYFNGFGVNPFEGAVAATEMAYGIARYSGATAGEVEARTESNLDTNLQNLVGKKVNYIEKDGKIIAILNAADKAGYFVVVDDNMGYTTMGYRNILAYHSNSITATNYAPVLATVNAYNSYWYNAPKSYAKGDLLVATTDALGNYDVTAQTLNTTARTIKVENGIGTGLNADDAAKAAVVSSSMVWILVEKNAQNATAETYVFYGVPANVEFTTSQWFIDGNFIYAIVANMPGFEPANTPNPTWDNKDVAYVAPSVYTGNFINNQMNNGLGINFKPNFAFSGLYSLDNAAFFNTNFNNGTFTLDTDYAENFYKVTNGYVDTQAKAVAGADYNVGLLLAADVDTTWSYKIIELAQDEIAGVLENGYQLAKNETATTVTGAIATLNYAKDGVVVGAPLNILTKTADYATVLAGMNGTDKALVVYYTCELDNAPKFLTFGKSVEVKAYEATTTTETTAMDVTVAFEVWGDAFKTVKDVNKQVAVYEVNENGLLTTAAGTFAAAEGASAFVLVDADAKLYNKIDTLTDGEVTATTTVNTNKKYAIVINRALTAKYDIYAYYCLQGIDDDTFVKSNWAPIYEGEFGNLDVNATANDIVIIEVSKDMAAEDGVVYIGLYFEKAE